MKRISLAFLLIVALASPAMAGQIWVGAGYTNVNDYRWGYGPYMGSGGGDYTIGVYQSGLSTAGYVLAPADGTRDIVAANTLQTFCIEVDETVYPDDRPWVTIGMAAYGGGIGGGSPDPISRGTAYLYSQFAMGTLSYNYAGSGRTTSAELLQQAFWMLENEESYSNTNLYIQLVEANVTNPMLDAAWGENGVFVMNLWAYSDNTGAEQSLLYHSVPDGGTTLMLLGGALMGLGALRRRFRQ